MAAISTLTPDIRTYIPELPGFVVQRHVIRAVREFCEETRAWRTNINLTTTANVSTINLASLLPINTELVDVISMKNSGGGAPVVPRTYAWLDENTSDWRGETNDLANYYVLNGNNTLQLIPTPATTSSNLYNTRVAVKPTLDAATLDDVLLNKYRETIISGTLGLLFMIPRKTWTDLQMAAYHSGRFNEDMKQARSEAADEFQTGVPRKVKYGGL